MKFRHTLILLLVAGALLAYVGLVERDRKTTKETAQASTQVVEFDRDKITSVTIKNPETKIEFAKEGQYWRMQADPIKDRADSMTLTQLFTTMETLRHDAVIEPEKPKDEHKEYGVADADTKVTFSGEGEKPLELLIGHDAAVEGKVYARVNGDDTVFVISNALKTQLNKKADEFRDRKLTELAAQQVTKLAVKTKDGETEFERKDNHWAITKPLQARGDDSKINDLIAQATTARIDTFVADPNLVTAGLAEPRGTVTFHTEGAEKPVVLEIGDAPKDEKDKEKLYVKLSTRDSIVIVPKDVEKIATTGPNELRDRSLLRVESDIVDRITIEPAGKEKLVLARKGESWVRKVGEQELPTNAALPARILSDLQSTQVTNFVSDTATNLAEYGLDEPAVKVTLSSFASENTPESKAGEQAILSVLIGKQEGDNGYAKLDSEPFIVAVPKTLIESLPTDPIQLQDLTIYELDPKKLTTLEVVKKGQPPISLKQEKGEWQLAKGDAKLNAPNVQMFVNTLAVLRATRWSGPTRPPDEGINDPSVTVAFTSAEGEKTTSGKLIVGSSTTDNEWYATAEGRPGSFLLSRPDYDNLQLALVDAPAAAVPPSTPSLGTGTPATNSPATPPAPPADAPEAVPAPAPSPAPVPEPAAPLPPASIPVPATPEMPEKPGEAPPAAPAPADPPPAPVVPPAELPLPEATPPAAQ